MCRRLKEHVTLSEDLGSVPNTYIMDHSHLLLKVCGIQDSFLTTKDVMYTHTHRHADTHKYILSALAHVRTNLHALNRYIFLKQIWYLEHPN